MAATIKNRQIYTAEIRHIYLSFRKNIDKPDEIGYNRLYIIGNYRRFLYRSKVK